jgi:hypothetical protein
MNRRQRKKIYKRVQMPKLLMPKHFMDKTFKWVMIDITDSGATQISFWEFITCNFTMHEEVVED